jgi:hypothetical protein
MAQAKFEKMTTSDTALYGPCKLLLCGFPAGAQTKLKTVLDMASLNTVPRVWVSQDQADLLLSELFKLPDDTGEGASSSLPRAIIVAGITEKELIRLMTVSRKTGMKPALWATLTPTSETWTLTALLAELSAERRALQKKTKKKCL